MAWSFTTEKPVYLQVADRLRKMVLSGEYALGEQLATVRQLATTAAVNPNTVQRAFIELESEGIIVSKGTVGRFVTDDPAVLEACRKSMAEAAVKAFVKEMHQLSVVKDDVIKLIEEEDV